ncbi:hypothetical protein BT96DRAFT_941596 [Gymnopus androsaceus JB14]|uniref:Uncharacterized protein n=1 Tax=Gymnopus androsaceus JB14 TaxID=1447944 RepID=A0A6A4HE04_9AGAR|nr:hypothetical protein BT96DRAFT_941596 [Gymnopus androsaceus JB14]
MTGSNFAPVNAGAKLGYSRDLYTDEECTAAESELHADPDAQEGESEMLPPVTDSQVADISSVPVNLPPKKVPRHSKQSSVSSQSASPLATGYQAVGLTSPSPRAPLQITTRTGAEIPIPSNAGPFVEYSDGKY